MNDLRLTDLIYLTVLFTLSISVIKLWIELKAMKGSTHKLSFLNPSKQDFEKLSEKTIDDLTKSLYDNVQ